MMLTSSKYSPLIRHARRVGGGARGGNRRRLPRPAAVIFIITCAWALTGASCLPSSNLGQAPAQNTGPALTMWGLWQESADMGAIAAAFEEQTGTKVEYKKIASVAEYERQLIQALAERRGPDIFVMHHSWVNNHRPLLAPAPATVVDEKAVRDEYVDVVADDLVRDGVVWGLPHSVDTLVLYYNRDIFAANGIARPPRTWQEFQQIVERLTKITRFSTIERSAAALGTARNVNRAPDILQLLMLQSGLPIGSAPGATSINNDIGLRSLQFYTDFANKSKKVYTWDLQQDFSIDAFAEGDTAMMLGYSYHVPVIRAKNPRLQFNISPAPQIADSQPANLASYWPFAVSSASPNQGAAWQFIRFATSAPQAQALNAAAGTPTAHRLVLEQQLRDPLFSAFAEQALTAKTWARPDPVAVDSIFTTLIDSVITGAATIEEAMGRAETQLNQAAAAP